MKHDDLDQVTDPKVLYDLGLADNTLMKTEQLIQNIDHAYDNKPYSTIMNTETEGEVN